MSEYRGRDIPWLPVVRFHKEVVTRAEEGFFSLNGRNDQDERWTSLTGFDPRDMAGPWRIDQKAVRSRPFRLTIEQGQHAPLFLGGPCYLKWSKSMQGSWRPQWCPLLYREVELRADDTTWEIVPRAGKWSITPLLFELFRRLEVDIGDSLDDFAARIIEKAVAQRRHEQLPMHESIFHSLFLEVPDAEARLAKGTRSGDFRIDPTPWVLFAPTNSFSALTRHLMKDYERLESLLEASPEEIGGLTLLEDRPRPQRSEEVDVLPLVPLNDSQRSAVQRILEEHPLTVVSGPPGTGKSQVVVALLLNAWACGKTVLFASNNNKAVDVVRERVERFESEFPIAVRAGAKEKQNIQEVLRRTLNMASISRTDRKSGVDLEKVQRRQAALLAERRQLQETLESLVPQRIDESRRTALQAYGEYRSTRAAIVEHEDELRAEQTALGFSSQPLAAIQETFDATTKWLDRITHFQQEIARDDYRRDDLQSRILTQERLRDQAVEEVGLAVTECKAKTLKAYVRDRVAEKVGLAVSGPGDWKWLFSGPSPELVSDWERRIRTILEKPVEQALEPIAWREEYNRWTSAESAETWASKARDCAEEILRTCAAFAPKLKEIRALSEAVERSRSHAESLGIPADVSVSLEALRQWSADYAEYATTERGIFDFLLWSQCSRLRRSLRRRERHIRSGFPLQVWTRIGPLNDNGREKLATVIEAARQWIELRLEWKEMQTTVDGIEASFRGLRSEVAALGIRDVPTDRNADAWSSVASQCGDLAALADDAVIAWRRRAEKEMAEERLRSIAKEWATLASGVPIREAWRRGQGAEFDQAIRSLAESPTTESVRRVRAAFYTGTLDQLIECWRRARGHEESARRLRVQCAAVPEPGKRVQEWWSERPAGAFVLEQQTKEWPDIRQARERLQAVEEFCDRVRRFVDDVRPALTQKAQRELEWAVDKLGQAIDVLPEGHERVQATELFERIKENPEADWPVSDLNAAFAEFSPDRIRAKIDRVEAELERRSFEVAKANWLQRIRTDDEAIRAVDRLEKSLRQYRGVVPENLYGTFRRALCAVPIWITTAQSSQAIPLEPELFDIVVIDEASQCTLTNLLPLVYRGRTLAVIGDDNQLPAIPTIQESEELVLARKYDIEDHLTLVGHATNDVYKTATESLPRRRADVLMLDEHFRSNPQIIGFSNRHIYLQRLELKKDPSWGKRLPVASGVHVMSVAGQARRGPKGQSWVNPPEAEMVLKLVQRLRQGDGRSLSLGVVTPFAAQKELLRDQLDRLRLSADVLVDTAYGFQGDERDVIIFSPVVSKGITPSAGRWVESPPNLVNVAITRAREALFVVGDIDFCLQQEGILRKLALYCNDIRLLRETSDAELELFSWMVVKGWEPKVHPRVGDLEVDFVLDSSNGDRLAIEVDGRQHTDTIEQDKARDAYLQGQGYVVMRIPAREVLETPFEVVYRIAQIIQ